jgi:hypothetical protein
VQLDAPPLLQSSNGSLCQDDRAASHDEADSDAFLYHLFTTLLVELFILSFLLHKDSGRACNRRGASSRAAAAWIGGSHSAPTLWAALLSLLARKTYDIIESASGGLLAHPGRELGSGSRVEVVCRSNFSGLVLQYFTTIRLKNDHQAFMALNSVRQALPGGQTMHN